MGDCAGGEMVWVISNEASLAQRVEDVVRPLAGNVSRLTRADVENEGFWNPLPASPDLIVLDIGSEVDWGLWALRRLKRGRIKAPIVVVTGNLSREFGEKILPEGVRYYVARDFSATEFREVTESLLKLKRPSA